MVGPSSLTRALLGKQQPTRSSRFVCVLQTKRLVPYLALGSNEAMFTATKERNTDSYLLAIGLTKRREYHTPREALYVSMTVGLTRIDSARQGAEKDNAIPHRICLMNAIRGNL